MTKIIKLTTVLTVLAGVVGCSSLTSDSEQTIQYQCGAAEVALNFTYAAATLHYKGSSTHLQQVVSASGARYNDGADPVTQYWGKGNEATIIWQGQELPTCVEKGTLPKHFTGRGNEPFWQVAVNPQHMTITTPNTEAIVDVAPAKVVSENPYEWRIDSATATQLVVIDTLCRDSMSGRLYPYQVDLHEDGNVYSGCGGDSEWLVQGVEWQLVKFGDHPLNTKTPTLSFLADGQLTGFNGCNRYFGQYNLGGELAQIQLMGSTKMACPETASQLEREFSDAMQRVYQVFIDNNERLVLTTRGNRQLIFVEQQ